MDGITTDRDDPRLDRIETNGQQEAYLVLSQEEISKGYVRPLRFSYRHLECGTVTTMGVSISMTYARDPNFYGATFCVACKDHFRLRDANGPHFEWLDKNGEPDGTFVGD